MLAIHWADIMHFCPISTQFTTHHAYIVQFQYDCNARRSPAGRICWSFIQINRSVSIVCTSTLFRAPAIVRRIIRLTPSGWKFSWNRNDKSYTLQTMRERSDAQYDPNTIAISTAIRKYIIQVWEIFISYSISPRYYRIWSIVSDPPNLKISSHDLVRLRVLSPKWWDPVTQTLFSPSLFPMEVGPIH